METTQDALTFVEGLLPEKAPGLSVAEAIKVLEDNWTSSLFPWLRGGRALVMLRRSLEYAAVTQCGFITRRRK